MGELVISWNGKEPLVFYPTESKEFRIRIKLDKSIKDTAYQVISDYDNPDKEVVNR